MRRSPGPLRTSHLSHAISAASVLLCAIAGPIRAAAGQPLPFVRLFDTRAPFEAASCTSWSPAPGWEAVPEGNLGHEFQGAAVFMNDRAALVVRKGADGAELWWAAAGGPRRRALLRPLGRGGRPAERVSTVTIAENDPAAVMLDVTFRTAGGQSSAVSLRLTAGDLIVEVRAGAGTHKLDLTGQMRYVVVPDFFGDDVVFGPETSQRDRLGLPTENLFLSFLDGGDAILVCTWRSPQSNADVVFTSDGAQRAIRRCTVECAPGESVWIACLEGAGIWHARALGDADRAGQVVLPWQPPFPAKWRASFVRGEGVADSWDFEHAQAEGQSPAGAPETGCPCWFADGRAHIGIPEALTASEASPYKAVVIYPIDRSRATPLTTFCPIDVMRNTLGVGPCQYILAMEGLGGEGHPTPADVTEWVERQFERGRDSRAAGAIKERLAGMVAHISHAQQRLDRYADFAGHVRRLSESTGEPAAAADPRPRLLAMAEEMDRLIVFQQQAMQSARPAAELADGIVALIGAGNAVPEVKRMGAELRSIGACQDEALARCRMTVRRIKQACRTAATQAGPTQELIQRVQDLAGQMLRVEQ